MKLLIVTQAVDDAHPVLGFFTRWIAELAARFERIEVICLTEGAHALPKNVRVHSLGKSSHTSSGVEKRSPLYERVRNRARYAMRFIALSWRLRRDYDAVLVHMNEEYLLLSGWLWLALGKRLYLWRNHGSGSIRTRIAASFCRAVFYTSSASYTARLRNAVRMPVGVDLARFTMPQSAGRIPGSMLMVGRISKRKRVREVIEALIQLVARGMHPSLTLVGPADGEDARYRDECVALASAARIGLSVRGSVSHADLPRVYAEHDIVVNASEPGMFDKTMLEAMASGCLLITRHEDLATTLDPRLRTDGSPVDLAKQIHGLILMNEPEKEALRKEGAMLAREYGLESLVNSLAQSLADERTASA